MLPIQTKEILSYVANEAFEAQRAIAFGAIALVGAVGAKVIPEKVEPFHQIALIVRDAFSPPYDHQ